MTITRSGSNQKYADGWERAFGGKTKKSASSSKLSRSEKKVAKKKKKK
jgi:hypothetical protein